MNNNHYMGYCPSDLAMPFAKFYEEKIAPAPPHISEALAKSPFPAGTFPPVEKAADLQRTGHTAFENGYTLQPDGSLRVAALTKMPGVAPPMWGWWFGWHSSADNRYKLWHPKAHRSARWQDGSDDDTRYVGRTSLIEEYIGKKMEKAAIRFVPPAELGISDKNKEEAVYICARVGYSSLPIDFGWLVHQIRAVEGGSEMRSRFWMGGEYIALRWQWMPGFFSKILQKSVKLPEQQAKDLLIHCAEEMNHLAAFLPQLYEGYKNGIF